MYWPDPQTLRSPLFHRLWVVLALLACLPTRAPGADDFDIWAEMNQYHAEIAQRGFFGRQTLPEGRMPVRPAAGRNFANGPDVFRFQGGLLLADKYIQDLNQFSHREGQWLQPGEVKAYRILTTPDGMRVVGLTEAFPYARIGTASDGPLLRQPRVGAPVLGGQIWVSRSGYSFQPPAPRSPFDTVSRPPVSLAGGLPHTPFSLSTPKGPNLLGQSTVWDRPRLAEMSRPFGSGQASPTPPVRLAPPASKSPAGAPLPARPANHAPKSKS